MISESENLLLRAAMTLGLNKRRPYVVLTSGYALQPEERVKYFAELQADCDKATAAQEAVRWLDEQQQIFGGVSSLAIQGALRGYTAVMTRPHHHIVDLHGELAALRKELQSHVDLYKAYSAKLGALRERWNRLLARGRKGAYLEMSLGRLEAQAESGYLPDPEKIHRVEETLQKAEYESNVPFEDDAGRIRGLALALIERQKDQMTVAQSEEIQKALNSLGQATSRREVWNLLRASERSGHSPLVFAALEQVRIRSKVELDGVVVGWKTLAEGLLGGASLDSTRESAGKVDALRSKGQQRGGKKKGTT